MMPPHPDPTQPASPTTNGLQRFAPFVVLLAISGLLTARWIWMAGITDYAWIYELGMRVRQGEVPYRDFICTLPQLTSYTLVPFLALFKGNLWGFAIHLYLWWLATLWVGLLAVRKLGLSTPLQSASVFLAACVSFPPVGLGHAYSYAGTFFFGLLLLCLLQHRTRPQTRYLLLGGASAGIALLAKQNIGIVALVFGLMALAQVATARENGRSVVRDATCFVAGAAATFLPAFIYFASHAGAGEVWSQMFLDAGAGKGGIDRMLANVLPLFPFTAESADYLFWTLPVSGLVSLVFLGVFGCLADIGQTRKPQPTTQREIPIANPSFLLAGAFILVVLVSIVSLFNLPQWRATLDSLVPRFIYGYIGPLIAILYSALNALSVISLLNLWLRKRFDLLLPTVALPLILWGHEISAHGYLVYSAPLAVPLAFHLGAKQFTFRHSARLAYVLGAVCVFTHAFFPHSTYRLGTFEPLERLPDDSRFANLWAARNSAEAVKELLTNVTPRIEGKRTLWLSAGGPHLAYGGEPVRSVALLHFDTYSPRSEAGLAEEWNRQPPDFVFMGYYLPCVGSRLFTREALNQWLERRYQRVWKSTRRDAVLWELKPTSHSELK